MKCPEKNRYQKYKLKCDNVSMYVKFKWSYHPYETAKIDKLE
jgi:hypothetical protein